MNYTKCLLCGKDIPIDDKKIGAKMALGHEFEHRIEKQKLGMTMPQYIAYCRERVGDVSK